jgi:hypothetical protein
MQADGITVGIIIVHHFHPASERSSTYAAKSAISASLKRFPNVHWPCVDECKQIQTWRQQQSAHDKATVPHNTYPGRTLLAKAGHLALALVNEGVK